MVAAIMLVSALALTSRAQAPASVTVYKSASCGCCANWVEHMRAAGFQIASHDVDDIAVVKRKYSVPADLESCHTAVVGGYVLEGHVPADVVKRLLAERPKVVGVAVPGMPMGSPGMEVPGRKDSYNIISFDQAGQHKVYDRR
jgi:hypothetical protein